MPCEYVSFLFITAPFVRLHAKLYPSRNVSYQLLHLINLIDCTVTCTSQIDGAIHITSCAGSTISASCRQLRIHETTNLRCYVTAASGPILEDSSKITFYASPDDTVIRETKDFNWFRSEPSPNFEIVSQELTHVNEPRQAYRSVAEQPAAPRHDRTHLETRCDDMDNDDDDDNEL